MYFEAAIWDADQCPRTIVGGKQCKSATYYIRMYVKRFFKYCSTIQDALGDSCWAVKCIADVPAVLLKLAHQAANEKDLLLEKELKRLKTTLGPDFEFICPWSMRKSKNSNKRVAPQITQGPGDEVDEAEKPPKRRFIVVFHRAQTEDEDNLGEELEFGRITEMVCESDNNIESKYKDGFAVLFRKYSRNARFPG